MLDISPLDRMLDILGTTDKIEAKQQLDRKFPGGDLKKATTQWSQLVAWSWLEPDDYPADRQPTPAQEDLRAIFIAAIKATALILIQEQYQAGELLEDIKTRSDQLSDILNGTTKSSNSSIGLPDLYQQITNKNDYFFTKDHTNSFLWVTSIQRFTGICAGYLTEADQIVQVLAYPPRPTSSTLPTEELRTWSQQENTQGSYLPPTPYIPTCNC